DRDRIPQRSAFRSRTGHPQESGGHLGGAVARAGVATVGEDLGVVALAHHGGCLDDRHEVVALTGGLADTCSERRETVFMSNQEHACILWILVAVQVYQVLGRHPAQTSVHHFLPSCRVRGAPTAWLPATRSEAPLFEDLPILVTGT